MLVSQSLTDPSFLARVLFQADNRRDQLFRKAMMATDRLALDLSLARHDALVEDILACKVSPWLPGSILSILPPRPPPFVPLPTAVVPFVGAPPPAPTFQDRSPAAKRPRYSEGQVWNPIHQAPYRVRQSEPFYKTFVPHKAPLTTAFPDVCLNWHILVRCWGDCSRVTDHKNPSPALAAALEKFVSDVRASL